MFIRTMMLFVTFVMSTMAAFAAAPIPKSSQGVPIPQDKGCFVEEIRDGLYWVTEGAYTVMFLTTGKGAIVIDAPPSFGDKILKAIKEVTKEPITHVVYTHSHADHIAGAYLYPKGATYIAHEDTLKRLERMDDPNRHFPTVSLSGESPFRCRPSHLKIAIR